MHRKRPRQIFNHQRLHASVCLQNDSSGAPVAYLPDLWINPNGEQYGWTEVIHHLRDQDKVARAFINKSTILIPSEHPSIASAERRHFRETVRNTSHTLETSSRRQSQRESSPGHQSLNDPASSGGRGMSCQSKVIQNTSPGEDVLAERVPSPVIPSLPDSPVTSPVAPPVASPVILPVASSVASLASVSPSIPLSDWSLVKSEFMLPAEAIEWDLLDCNAIPALIGGVLRGTNVTEFLRRLQMLACSGRCLFIAVDFFLHEIFQTLARRIFKRETETSSLRWFDKYVAIKSTLSILGWPFR